VTIESLPIQAYPAASRHSLRELALSRLDRLRGRFLTPSTSVYIGIDVACALGKRLPIRMVSAEPWLMPLTVPRELAALIPRGVGNKEVFTTIPFQDSARCVAQAIAHILNEIGWHVERIAVDAPAAPPDSGSRESEIEMGSCGLSSFRTPAASAWPGILQQCHDHRGRGGTSAALPHANKIWMLYGFRVSSNT
jgi:hypothetical protein